MNRRLIAALAAALALAGCSPASDIVARVGNSAITTEDYEVAAKQSGSQYAQFGDSAKFLFVDDLVRRQLLIEAAKASGLYRDSTFLAFVATARDRAARDALLRSYQGGTAAVSEAEALALYAKLGVESHVRVMVTSTKDAADAANERLARGVAFEEVANQFNTTGLTPAGGDAGWLAVGVLPPVLDARLLDAPVGEVLGPLHSPGQGWFLMRIDERREATPAPFAELRGPIVDRLRQRKGRAAFIRALERLRVEYEVRLADGAADVMTAALRDSSGLGTLETAASLPPQVLAGALGRYRGGVYTVADALTDMHGGTAAPNLAMTPAVERWIESQTLERAILVEARARHAHEEPRTQRAIRTQEDGWLLETYYSREVMNAVVITPEALQAEYAVRQREMARLEGARVAWVALADSNAALAVAMAVRSGVAAGLADAVAQAAPGAEVHTEFVPFPNDDYFWMGQQRNLTMMREGAVGGPFPGPDGYRFFQLLGRSQSVPRWDELDPQILQQLQSLAIERQREMRFAALTDSLRRAIPVSLDRAKIQKLEWPAEAMVPPGTSMGMSGGGS